MDVYRLGWIYSPSNSGSFDPLDEFGVGPPCYIYLGGICLPVCGGQGLDLWWGLGAGFIYIFITEHRLTMIDFI